MLGILMFLFSIATLAIIIRRIEQEGVYGYGKPGQILAIIGAASSFVHMVCCFVAKRSQASPSGALAADIEMAERGDSGTDVVANTATVIAKAAGVFETMRPPGYNCTVLCCWAPCTCWALTKKLRC